MDEKTRVGGPEDPREGLEAVVTLRRMLEASDAAQVENASVAGWSWASIAGALGVSRQAVHKKHAMRIKEKYPGRAPGGGRAHDVRTSRREIPQVRGGRF